MNNDDRKLLQNITESQEMTPSEVTHALHTLGIKLLPDPESWQRFGVNINCFAYALGLDNSEKYIKVAEEDAILNSNKYFASSSFMQFMLGASLLGEKSSQAIDDIIVYFDVDGRPKHAGKVSAVSPDIKIISKWGTHSIYEHGLFQVPENFGTKVRYYYTPDLHKSEGAFVKYTLSEKEAVSQIK